MPRRELLSATQREAMLAVPTTMSAHLIARYYTLSAEDRVRIDRHRRDANRLGFAVQLAYHRFPGRTWTASEAVSPLILDTIARQLQIDPEQIAHYARDREATRFDHLAELQHDYDFHPFTTQVYRSLSAWLLPQALATDTGIVLVQALIDELRRRQVLIPGITTVEGMAWEVRRRAQRVTYQHLTAGLTDLQRAQLQGVLTVPTASRQTILVWLRQPAGEASPANFQKVIERLRWIRALGLDPSVTRHIHQNCLQQLTREGARMTAQHLQFNRDDRRDATLVAFLLATAEDLVDAALEMHDKLLGQQFKKGERKHEDQLKQSRKAINEKVRLYARIGSALIRANMEHADAYQAISSVITWERFVATVAEAEHLMATTEVDSAELLVGRYAQFRKYTKDLLATFTFQGTTAQAPVLQALDVIKTLNDTGQRAVPRNAPTSFVTTRWEKHVLHDASIDRHAYETCALAELRSGLRSGDIWIAGSRQYKAFEDYLLPAAQWEELKRMHATGVDVAEDVATYLTMRKDELHQQLTTVAGLIADEHLPDVRLAQGNFVITPLTKAVPDEALALARHAYALLPHVKLPELLLEVDAWTGWSRHFTHLHTGEQPQDRTALFAAVLADGINLGLTQMAETCAEMTFNRLAWVADWHMRDETYTKALAELINYHHQVPFAAHWGDGTTSSSDGQRFKAGGRPESLAAVNLRYGTEAGSTFYTHLSDQYGPYRTKVISAAVRDAPHMVDGLLYHATDLPIHEHYTDTWGYTDQVFGITHLLGFRFAPRIRDLGDKRIYSIEKPESYPALAALIGGTISTKHIEQQWDDLLRLTSSIRKGTVAASLILGKLAAYPRQNGLAWGLREVGRIEKSLFALEWLQSPTLRRRVQVGLNKGEARNALARAVFFNRLGELRDRTYEDQRHRASGLNLVTAAIMLWNTVYLAEAVAVLKQQGMRIDDDHLRHLAPVGWEHISLTGDYQWNFHHVPASGHLRLLRIPPR